MKGGVDGKILYHGKFRVNSWAHWVGWHVVSHFCKVSSNKSKWGAISSWLISVELVLLYHPPLGFSEVELQSVGSGLDDCVDIDQTGAEKCEQEMEARLRTSARGSVCLCYTANIVNSFTVLQKYLCKEKEELQREVQTLALIMANHSVLSQLLNCLTSTSHRIYWPF